MWGGPGREQAAAADGNRVRGGWGARARCWGMEGGSEMPHSQILHCSPLRLKTAPPESQ